MQVEAANAKIPASLAGIADLLGVLEHSKLALNVAFVVRYEYFLHPKLGNLQEVPRESVHIYRAIAAHSLSGLKPQKLSELLLFFSRKCPTTRSGFKGIIFYLTCALVCIAKVI